jgi:O-antigen ligase
MIKTKFLDYVPQDIPRPLPAGWYGHLHNIYIHYAAERGLPALLALLWLLAKILRDFARAIRRLPPGPSDQKFILHGALAVLLAVMVAGVFELNLGDSEVLAMFLAVVACGYLAAEKVLAEEPRRA